ncbi:hypothetical protein [Segatella bryantii]|uniref:hypothetical protein n=1 Tax=Segatella bryantii TaxID=77095 RepID=UPI001C408D0C|nr:hypothetical protein [Segatella bryantii]
MDSNKPHFVSSAFKKDEEYIHWLQKVKEQYRSSQAKAAMRVNDAMTSSIGSSVMTLWI